MGWDGLGRGMVVTGSGVLWRGRLDGRDARGGPGEIVLRMTWKVWTCPWGVRSLGINREGELRGNRLSQGWKNGR